MIQTDETHFQATTYRSLDNTSPQSTTRSLVPSLHPLCCGICRGDRDAEAEYRTDTSVRLDRIPSCHCGTSSRHCMYCISLTPDLTSGHPGTVLEKGTPLDRRNWLGSGCPEDHVEWSCLDRRSPLRKAHWANPSQHLCSKTQPDTKYSHQALYYACSDCKFPDDRLSCWSFLEKRESDPNPLSRRSACTSDHTFWAEMTWLAFVAPLHNCASVRGCHVGHGGGNC